MAMAHANASAGILLHALGFGIAKEHHNGVADIFADGGAVLERDVRHFGQIAVEQADEILRFELVGGLGEVDDVREEDGQFLAVRRDLDILRTGEDRVVDLRGKIFRQLLGERF
jgi:hypothetical protein